MTVHAFARSTYAVSFVALLLSTLPWSGCAAYAEGDPGVDRSESGEQAVGSADPFCKDGVLSTNGEFCCAASCGSCGGSGCSQRPGGAEACCTGRIQDSGRSCQSKSAPCVMPDTSACDDGLLSSNGEVCCAASCGSCGGSGCSQRPGGASACCTGKISTANRSCADNPPPCVMTDGTGGSSTSSGGSSSGLTWRKANLTTYESYPDPDSDECIKYSGCEWAGQFAALDDKQSESWVKSHNIASVHSKDFNKYKLKTLRLRQGSRQIDVKVYDMCADSDCSGCCSANSSSTDFLIDLEKYTAQRFGSDDGVVEWACLDC